jgi:VWFA-related protein
VAFKTAYELLQNMQQVNNRRKAIIWVSSGYDFDPFADARRGLEPGSPFLSRYGARPPCDSSDPENQDNCSQGNPFLNDPNSMSQGFADADLAFELTEITRAANRANATFYTLDPRGLVAGQDMTEEVSPFEWNRYLMKTQDSLRMMAENTGGIAVVNTNQFDRALKRIDNETSDYYILGFYSKNPDPTKRTREIEVKVKRDGTDVWARTSYSLKPSWEVDVAP